MYEVKKKERKKPHVKELKVTVEMLFWDQDPILRCVISSKSVRLGAVGYSVLNGFVKLS